MKLQKNVRISGFPPEPVGGFSQLALLVLCAGLVLAAVGGYLASLHKLRVPEVLKLDDFQRPLDLELTAYLGTIGKTAIAQFCQERGVRPFLDDVRIAGLEANAVELVDGQLPDCERFRRIANQCAGILKVRSPKIFISSQSTALVGCADTREPVLIIGGPLADRSMADDELRFLIGRELGHFKCGHTKWLNLRGTIVKATRSMVPVPDELAFTPLLPFFKWSREAEMSADNAGLICCQNRAAAEQAILRQLHGGSEQALGLANPELFLAQAKGQPVSQFAEIVSYWRQISSPVPFAAERIQQLREYETSNRYQHLW